MNKMEDKDHERRCPGHDAHLPGEEIKKGGRKMRMNAGNAILWGAGIVAGGIVGTALVYVFAFRPPGVSSGSGVVLPVVWGAMGQQMVKAGVIDEAKFKALYARSGGLSPDMVQMLDGSNNGQIKMTPQNAGIILNMLWALGLGQNSAVLTAGPMVTNGQVKPGQFASTGGWTLAVGGAMDHYAKHDFLDLTPSQEQLVENVAKNIYRPCCDNSAYFPDCNHGMAMLGLLELMASQGATADEMYRTALVVNSYWFPDAYLTIAEYLRDKGIAWSSAKPEDILSASYSSARGYQQILSQTPPAQSNQSGGGGCST